MLHILWLSHLLLSFVSLWIFVTNQHWLLILLLFLPLIQIILQLMEPKLNIEVVLISTKLMKWHFICLFIFIHLLSLISYHLIRVSRIIVWLLGGSLSLINAVLMIKKTLSIFSILFCISILLSVPSERLIKRHS